MSLVTRGHITERAVITRGASITRGTRVEEEGEEETGVVAVPSAWVRVAEGEEAAWRTWRGSGMRLVQATEYSRRTGCTDVTEM